MQGPTPGLVPSPRLTILTIDMDAARVIYGFDAVFAGVTLGKSLTSS